MRNRECGWVRARLPLWVGDRGPDASESNGEGGDLVAEERYEIGRHLAVCTGCHVHQIALEQALGTLLAASALAPVAPRVPSLWPTLERRIADHDAITTPRRLHTGAGLADRLAGTWLARDRKRPQLGSILVNGAIASLLVSLVTGTIARWQWLNAQSIIAGNTAPTPHVAAPTYPLDESLTKASDPDDEGEGEGEVLATHLAEVDPLRLPGTSGTGVLPSKPSIHTRLGYDLDHGTPVAPDTRESKPIY